MDNLEELKRIHAFMNDFWQVIKSTLHGDGSDAYWKQVIDGCGASTKKHGEHRLMQMLVLAYLDYLEAANENKSTK